MARRIRYPGDEHRGDAPGRSRRGVRMNVALPAEIYGPPSPEAGRLGNPHRIECNDRVWHALRGWVIDGCPPIMPTVPPPDPKPGQNIQIDVPPEAVEALEREVARTGRRNGELIRRLAWPDWQPTDARDDQAMAER